MILQILRKELTEAYQKLHIALTKESLKIQEGFMQDSEVGFVDAASVLGEASRQFKVQPTPHTLPDSWGSGLNEHILGHHQKLHGQREEEHASLESFLSLASPARLCDMHKTRPKTIAWFRLSLNLLS